MKYEEIYSDLKQAILKRKIAPNTRVPSEKALTIKYNVSRITAKHALNKLEQDNLIYRIQGKGSFVKAHGTLNSYKILLVLPFSNNNDLGNYISGIQKVTKNTTWKIFSINNDEFSNIPLQQLFEEYAGIIYYPQDLNKDIPKLLKIYLSNFPLVLIDQTLDGLCIPSVVSDNVDGGFKACEHLIKNNCKKIAFYGNTKFQEDFTGSVSERFFGYIQALKKFQIKNFNPLKLAETIQEQTEQELIELIKAKKIDGIVAENDITAFKLLTTLQKNNLDIPKQIKIIGFDDLPITKLSSPKLSSISQDFEKLGAEAINLLLQQINDLNLVLNTHITVGVKLIKRESSLGV